MSDKIIKEDRQAAQKLIQEVFMVLSDVAAIEERLNQIRNHVAELYKKLDDIADGEDPR